MNDKPFVHLHVHTEFSLLDGLSQIPRLVSRAKALNMPALAITDHGTMFGVIDFYRACKNAGIKPIIGVEAYLAPRGMQERDPNFDKRPYHMLLLAHNVTGYRNLLKISTAGQLEGYYYRPRIDRDFLAGHADGLIATSGCLAAQIPAMVMEGRDDDARELVGWYSDTFGEENFFLELQQHDIPELESLNKWLVDYRKSLHTNVQLLATNDVHYVLKDDADPHDTLLCIQTGALKVETNRLAMSDPSYHLTSADEMWAYFHEMPEALHNTLKVADMCQLDLDSNGYHLPEFAVPEGYDAGSYLRYLCEKGLRWRYDDRAGDAHVKRRLDHELNIIHSMGFDTYFLIVWDLCEYARKTDIWWNVRGSGAGSLAAYSLGITSIDPLQNKLIFERFLNPGRVSMPDIDLDYPDDQREQMIAYTARKYGEDKVAAIITFGTMGAKAAVRDVGRALDIELSKVNRAASLIPTEAKQKPIMTYVESNPDLHAMYKQDDDIKRVVDTAVALQGVSRHASTHAAGVIVADKPLTEYLPLHRLTRGNDEDSAIKAVTQFPMETCESIGLLKIDFLGLATLTIMRKACELIERHHGIRYTMDNIPYRHDDLTDPDDKRKLDETFELIGRGDTVGVFQVESTGMQQMLRGMRPKQFENIVAAISLYRPGPMEYIPLYNDRMHGIKEIEYKHDLLKPILEETYGIIIYQEQIMQIAGQLFGYELGEGDLMRKAVSKKREKDLLKHKSIFKERGPEHDVDVESAEQIFNDIEFFANYGFNKAHASDYAVITVQTAYLKTHYPHEYMAALLSVHRDDVAKISTFLEECNRMNIPILPPDANHSMLDFDIQDLDDGKRGIRFGLAAIKNAGATPLMHLIEQREGEGAFRSLTDFCQRVDLRIVQKRALESLVKVGALQSLGNRVQLLGALERMVKFSAEYHHAKEVGQMSLFGESDAIGDEILQNLPEMEDVDERAQLGWEKELLGIYVTDHPLDAALRDLPRIQGLVKSYQLKDENENWHERPVKMLGLISSVRSFPTRNEQWMGVLQLEDRVGSIEVVLFPRSWSRYKDMVVEDSIVMVKGKADASRGDMQIIGDEVITDFDIIQSDAENEFDSTEAPGWVDSDEPPPWVLQEDFYEEETGEVAQDDVPQIVSEDVGAVAPATQGGVAEVTPAVEPASVPMTATATNGGAAHWMDDDDNLPEQFHFDDDEVEVDVEERWLMVYFQRTGDDERDRRRLRKLHGILTSYPGKDNFTVVIEGQDKPALKMEFPNHRTSYCDDLLRDLNSVVGLENIEVHVQPA